MPAQEPPSTPASIARDLGVDPKVVREWLRAEYPRPDVDKYQRWTIQPWLEDVIRHRFGRG